MFIPYESKTVKTRILEYTKAEGVQPGQFRYLHTGILILVDQLQEHQQRRGDSLRCKWQPGAATECPRYP